MKYLMIREEAIRIAKTSVKVPVKENRMGTKMWKVVGPYDISLPFGNTTTNYYMTLGKAESGRAQWVAWIAVTLLIGNVTGDLSKIIDDAIHTAALSIHHKVKQGLFAYMSQTGESI